jgi:hypothetical protein
MPEEIKKPEAPANAEKVKSETEKEVQEKAGATDVLDDVIAGRDVGMSAEDAFAKEAERINKEVEKEEKDEKKPEEKKLKEQEKHQKKEEDEPISEDFRKKYKVPEHIKTMKALVEWGPNAEKNMNKALSEKDKERALSTEAEKRLSKLESILENITQKKVDDGGMSEEERMIKAEKLRKLQDDDPVAYAEEIKRQVKEEALKEEKTKEDVEVKEIIDRTVKEIHEKQKQEWQELKAKYGDKFEAEIVPALKKIAAEEPTLKSFKVAEELYLYRLKVAEEQRQAEDEAKRREKEGLNSETSHKTVEVEGSEDDKKLAAIEGAKDLKELNKVLGIVE